MNDPLTSRESAQGRQTISDTPGRSVGHHSTGCPQNPQNNLSLSMTAGRAGCNLPHVRRHLSKYGQCSRFTALPHSAHGTATQWPHGHDNWAISGNRRHYLSLSAA
jgi:hypothetical protein